jgi:hypothetical protein
LAENGRDFEKLAGKRRDQNPVKQTEIKLDVPFQNQASADAQNAKVAATTKAENSGFCYETSPRFGWHRVSRAGFRRLRKRTGGIKLETIYRLDAMGFLEAASTG